HRLNITKLEDMAKIHTYYISNIDTELTHAAPNIELDELRQKVLDATLFMGLKDELEEEDNYTIDEIEEELFILEENRSDDISVESELLIIGNTMDLNSSKFKIQPLALDNYSSESIEDKIEEDHGNVEFDVDAL
ncbi:21889_t:CDS:1, partial [Racocetra persica]